MSPNTILPRKKVAQFFCYLSNFQKSAQSEQMPNGQKFGQSGHPADNLH
jgi:hypothetical protein